MVRGRQEDEWWRTASVVAMLAEVNRDTKKRSKPYRASEFVPPMFRRPVAKVIRPYDHDYFVKAFVEGAGNLPDPRPIENAGDQPWPTSP